MKPYYQDESMQIWLGDCREVLPTLEGEVAHVITDPPYSRDVYIRMTGHNSRVIDANYKGPGVAKMAAGAIGAVDELIEPCSVELARLVTRWAIVFSDAESCHLWKTALEESGMRYVRTGAWVKPDPMPQMSGDRPGVGFEPCTITHAQGKMRWNGGGGAAVWTHFTCKGQTRPDHPCPKPIGLMHQLVSLFTDPGDLILDPFMGSGTTLRAAKDLGRKAIGIEIEERYCEIAAKRMAQAVLPLAAATQEGA